MCYSISVVRDFRNKKGIKKMEEDSSENLILKRSDSDRSHILYNRQLSLSAIGLFLIIMDMYQPNEKFTDKQVLGLTLKRSYSKIELIQALDELIDTRYIEIVGYEKV